jgi:peptidoglycan/xylan/chitin deacetylase (PgdA/CDA1 family)
MDFELHWGLTTAFSLDSIKERLLETRQAIPRILELFQEYEIHATWAVVGLLFFGTRPDLLKAIPSLRPEANGHSPSPYDIVEEIGADEESDPYHYASSLVDRILAARNQEVASHTFAHCVWDHHPAEIAAFRADLRAARQTARTKGVDIVSLVFPQNKYTDNHLPVLREEGTKAFRGLQPYWYLYFDENHKAKQFIYRTLRFLDRHVSISGGNTHTWASVCNTSPHNIPGSLGLEFYSHMSWLRYLEPLRLRRIQSGMTIAARRKEIFHLWWHPHQFGIGVEKKLEFLKKLLDHFALLRERDGLESLTMQEVAERCALLEER